MFVRMPCTCFTCVLLVSPGYIKSKVKIKGAEAGYTTVVWITYPVRYTRTLPGIIYHGVVKRPRREMHETRIPFVRMGPLYTPIYTAL